MHIKIFTCICKLNFDPEKETVTLGKQAIAKLGETEKEIGMFVQSKKDAKIQWLQTSGSASEMALRATTVPYTQLTAIVSWGDDEKPE